MEPTPNASEPASTAAVRLVDVLRQLPERELDSLIRRMRIEPDHAKRLDVPSQVARSLLMSPELRDVSLIPGPTRELLRRLAEAKGVLVVDTLPPAVEPLVARGLVFARRRGTRIELLLPVAYILMLRTWEGEDPRSARPLLAQLHPEVASSIASHYLGRPAMHPLSLSLEPAWEVLVDPNRVASEVAQLAPLERKLLRAVEEVGGEVETEELLELEREPMRLRGAMGATPSRRGVGFALERRGFLIPVHPNRHVIPAEVASVVGAQRRQEQVTQRTQLLVRVGAEELAPHRARFSEDPTLITLAMMLGVADPSVEVRAGIGTTRGFPSRRTATRL